MIKQLGLPPITSCFVVHKLLFVLLIVCQLQLGASFSIMAFRRTQIHNSNNNDQFHHHHNHHNNKDDANGIQTDDANGNGILMDDGNINGILIDDANGNGILMDDAKTNGILIREAELEEEKHLYYDHDGDQQKQEQQPAVPSTNDDGLNEEAAAEREEQKQQKKGPQMIGMRALNVGYMDWIDAESHSVYMFAFTYFGAITLVLVSLLILVSCCYMYDCMGCYDPIAHKYGVVAGGTAGGRQSVFPMAPNEGGGNIKDKQQQQVVMVLRKDNKCQLASSRKWSSAMALTTISERIKIKRH